MEIGLIRNGETICKFTHQELCKSWLWNTPRFNMQSAYFDLVLSSDDNGIVKARVCELQKKWRVSYQTAFIWLASLDAHDYIRFSYDYETKVYTITIMEQMDAKIPQKI